MMKTEIENDLAIKTYLDKKKDGYLGKSDLVQILKDGYIYQHIYDDMFRVHFDSFAREYFLSELKRMEMQDIIYRLLLMMDHDKFDIRTHKTFTVIGCGNLLDVIQCDEFDIIGFEPILEYGDQPDSEDIPFYVKLKDKYAHLEGK